MATWRTDKQFLFVSSGLDKNGVYRSLVSYPFLEFTNLHIRSFLILWLCQTTRHNFSNPNSPIQHFTAHNCTTVNVPYQPFPDAVTRSNKASFIEKSYIPMKAVKRNSNLTTTFVILLKTVNVL